MNSIIGNYKVIKKERTFNNSIFFKKVYYFKTPKSSQVAPRIIQPRDKFREFKKAKDFLKLHELTTLDWKEWEEEGIMITVK